MTMRSKVYVVVEFGGSYEDAWEHTIGVCSTSELADKLKAQIEEEHDPSNCVISEEDWESISDRLYEAEESGYEYEDTVSGIKGLFPEYSEEDIKQAMKLYDDYLDWGGVVVREIDFYTELSDISNNGIDD